MASSLLQFLQSNRSLEQMSGSASIRMTGKDKTSDWTLAIGIALGALLVAFGTWVYTQWSAMDKPRNGAVWLDVPEVQSQLADGRMLSVKVNLRLRNRDDPDMLEGHEPALKAMIEQVGTTMTRADIKGREGVQRYGQAIQQAINGYLQDQHIDERVKTVAFNELVLLP
jgi:flagellar basal body-associated protein FliL